MRRFDAILCDIDGCLSPESSAPFDAAALARVAEHNRLAENRHDRPVLTLCSGRPQPFAEAMCRLLANSTLPVIAENGVWLYHPKGNRYDMDPRITREDIRAVQAAREWVETELGPQGVVMQPGKHASISLYHDNAEFLRSLEPRVRETFQQNGWPLRVSMTWFYINCDLTHVSKATAIHRLFAATGLTKERCAGIGDTRGDLMIADNVAWFACPSNAVEELRARADYIAPRPEAEGVLEILARLCATTVG
jgi:hydroxymethylpyrimidine pyrophosphatase-like HAD family hydrolase